MGIVNFSTRGFCFQGENFSFIREKLFFDKILLSKKYKLLNFDYTLISTRLQDLIS